MEVSLGCFYRSFYILDKCCIFTAEKQQIKVMTEHSKQYRLNSPEEPTDEMLQELMEDIAREGRASKARAEAEHRRRLKAVADEIAIWRARK